MEINTQHIGNVTLMGLRGRMDAANREEIMAVVNQELMTEGRRIILNLSGVDYISTSGLKVLRHVQDRLGNVVISDPSQRVREVLQITALDSTYQLYDQQADAIHAVSPIVNAHTHLELGWLDPHRPGVKGTEFVPWIEDTIGSATRSLGAMREKVSQAAVEKGIQTLIDAGTTTVGDISASGVSIEPLLASGLRGTVYLEIVGITPHDGIERLKRVRTLLNKWRAKERSGFKIGLAPQSPYSIRPTMWSAIVELARSERLPLCIKVAESPAERDFFLHGSGPVADHMKKVGMDFVSPRKSPIAYLEDMGVLALKPLLVHCTQVDDADIARIKAAGCAVVHCPRSNLRLRCGRMPLEKFLAAGVPVYLGTDGLGSSPSLDVMDELEYAVALHHGHVAPEAIAALVHRPFGLAEARVN